MSQTLSTGSRASQPGDATAGEDVHSLVALDALAPREIAAKAADVGARKAGTDAVRTLTLAILAGAFIALGAAFATTAVAGSAGQVPFGIARVIMGLVFSLGLVLVIVAGAELFTGNNLIVMAWAERRISLRRLLRNWALVYAGNALGAVATVVIIFLGRQYEFGDGAVGVSALGIAQAKCSLGFVQAVALGALCNALVCLAVWLSYAARSVTDKVMAVVFPISAFVALGFEHSVANMYFLPIGVLLRDHASTEFWSETGLSAADFPNVTWSDAIVDNLLPVTLGNVIGGAVMVGLVYWAIYLRRSDARA
jgi:formate transporter FocA